MAEILIDTIVSDSVEGTGIFDQLMKATEIRLEDQFSRQRINGTDYANVYLGAMQGALQQSIAFALGKQQADAQAELTRAQTLVVNQELINLQAQKILIDKQAIQADAELAQTTAQTTLITENVNGAVQDTLVKEQQVLNMTAEVLKTTATVASIVQDTSNAVQEGLLTTAQTNVSVQNLASMINSDLLVTANIALVEQQRTNLITEELNSDAERELTIQKALNLVAEELSIDAETAIRNQKVTNLVNENLAIVANTALSTQQRLNLITAETKITSDISVNEQQKLNLAQDVLKGQAEVDLIAQNEANALTSNDLIVSQKTKVDQEEVLLRQKTFTESAQIADVVDATTVTGLIGKQKILYQNQADGFIRDAEQRAFKGFTDIWTIAKSSSPDDAAMALPANANQYSMDVMLAKLAEGVGVTQASLGTPSVEP